MNKFELQKLLIAHLNNRSIKDFQELQSLWSGYGSLMRLQLDDDSSVILKLINHKSSSHPRGWDTDFSHQRKLKSYEVEINWYKSYPQASKDCYTPQYIASGEFEGGNYLLLEDLASKAMKPISVCDERSLKNILSWLASFHAKHLQSETHGLWDTGTYWHLETRPDEFEKITDPEIKNAAHKVDEILKTSKYQSIVHGDAKLANFLSSNSQIAAVDFQYVGRGVGVKDLAYFLSSIFDENELLNREKDCLDYYFLELRKNISDSELADAVWLEWKELYPFAFFDFYRFLQGWAPSHPKLNSYSEKIKQRVLQCL